MTRQTKRTAAEYQELGKKLQEFYDYGYVSWRRALGFSFLKGIATGAGAFIGGTVVIAILLWVLGFLDQVPLLERVIEKLQNGLNG